MFVPFRKFFDLAANRLMLFLSLFVLSVLLLITLGLVVKSLPILQMTSFVDLITGSIWRPSNGEFGFLPFIMGTLWVTGLAGIIAIPLSLLTALYLAEYAPAKVRGILKPAIDILAGIPSVVYGLWGVLFLALGGFNIGFNVLSAGIVLAVMTVPVITSVCEEVFRMVPQDVKEASLAVGANKWETAKFVVIRSSMPGIAAAIILGFSRALGETMAVLMVAGNVAKSPSSVFDPAYTLTALIANNYGEMMSVPFYDSALMFAALILMIVVVIFNIVARIILARIEKGWV